MIKTLTVVFIFSLFTFSSSAQDTDNFVLLVKNEGKLDVLFHRAISTATGAALGGLVGAAIEEGVRSSDDKKKLNQILPYISDKSCDLRLVKSLKKKLGKKNITLSSMDKSLKPDKGTRVLEIEIDNCGFKIVNTTYQAVSAFINFKTKLLIAGEKKPFFEEKFYITNKDQYSFPDLVLLGDGIERELDIVLRKAGKRVANKIIYRSRENQQ